MLTMSYLSIIIFIVPCLFGPKIWLWPPLSPRLPGSVLLLAHPVQWKNTLELEMMFLLSNERLETRCRWFVKNLKHNFQNSICKSVIVAPVWKAPWIICREQDPIFALFLWPFSTKRSSQFSNTCQFVLGPSKANWRNSKPDKNTPRVLLRFGRRRNCESRYDVSVTLFWLF